MAGAKRKEAGKGFLKALTKAREEDRKRTRAFRLGGLTIETNVEGFDPTALKGMTEADLRAIVEGPAD